MDPLYKVETLGIRAYQVHYLQHVRRNNDEDDTPTQKEKKKKLKMYGSFRKMNKKRSTSKGSNAATSKSSLNTSESKGIDINAKDVKYREVMQVKREQMKQQREEQRKLRQLQQEEKRLQREKEREEKRKLMELKRKEREEQKERQKVEREKAKIEKEKREAELAIQKQQDIEKNIVALKSKRQLEQQQQGSERQKSPSNSVPSLISPKSSRRLGKKEKAKLKEKKEQDKEKKRLDSKKSQAKRKKLKELKKQELHEKREVTKEKAHEKKLVKLEENKKNLKDNQLINGLKVYKSKREIKELEEIEVEGKEGKGDGSIRENKNVGEIKMKEAVESAKLLQKKLKKMEDDKKASDNLLKELARDLAESPEPEYSEIDLKI